MEETLFKNIKVLEFASVLAGPAVGMFFAELGAKVIKVENKTTNGDVTRSWKLASENKENTKSAYYHSVNWNKEVVLLDLKNEPEKAIALIKEADIVISNFKYGSAEKLGLDYNSIKAIKPDIILGEVNAYGKNNPKPGFDLLLQAETGWLSMTGEQNGNPVKLPVALIDILSAHQLKEGLLLAWIHKLKTGEGARVSVSLYDTAIASLANQASNYLNAGHIPTKMGTQHPNIAPYGDLFSTKDQVQIVFAIGTDKQFHTLFNLLNLGTKIDFNSLNQNIKRVQIRASLNNAIQLKLNDLSFADLNALLENQNIPFSRIKNLKELFENEDAKRLILEQEEAAGQISKRVRTNVFDIELG